VCRQDARARDVEVRLGKLVAEQARVGRADAEGTFLEMGIKSEVPYTDQIPGYGDVSGRARGLGWKHVPDEHEAMQCCS